MRLGDSTLQRTEWRSREAESCRRHGGITSPGPSSSVPTVSETRTSRAGHALDVPLARGEGVDGDAELVQGGDLAVLLEQHTEVRVEFEQRGELAVRHGAALSFRET